MTDRTAKPAPQNPSGEELTPAERERYARHLMLPEIGPAGQRKLKAASVLCIGAGGLGSPVTMYLAAAGVGRIGLVDDDAVERSNLQRQILFGESDLGQPKASAAADRLRDINPHLKVDIQMVRFTAANAMRIAADYDVIIDGTDNFPTRYLSNDVAVFLGKPNIYGSIFRFEGQCSVFYPKSGGPCYRCLFPEPPEPGQIPSCAEGGVLGVLPGLIGSLQALEAIKLITGAGDPLVGRLVHFDALSLRFRQITLRRDPTCPVCGETPTITAPIDYEAFCGGKQSESASADSIPEISVAELQRRLAEDNRLVLLDVRTPAEREIAAIRGALSIPLDQLAGRLSELDRDRPIAVHCKSGARSADATRRLREAGLDAVNVAGGIDAWSREIDPDMPTY